MNAETKLTIKMLSQIFDRVTAFGLGILLKKCIKKVAKTRICPTSVEDSNAKTSHPIKFLRPHCNSEFLFKYIKSLFCIDVIKNS